MVWTRSSQAARDAIGARLRTASASSGGVSDELGGNVPLAFMGRDPAMFDHPIARRLFDEGMRALPDPYGDGTEPSMPQKPHIGRCRICGSVTKLTREHVPPAAAFNLDR